ncbi:BZ3500_MvSof-1268-A1-R1_Chr3-1g05437 [Microbotryum saponariae]|uniref:BZ3500_MvSof-1268-A1-R1_Chr3-1g05437 protein n=1 Tax=Microbotryum saponariae TaxID=289078 RepID=A0A2X0LHX3_9BASI|nr:BZ3500_MvSof-1268-A1-R1_Chr3-1g05437 [Microbotryum saponariae]SDA04628.1 BZ3501_MvSof-1269-A2-R1_Chr3-1g05108 [Microbotryum saponariae]
MFTSGRLPLPALADSSPLKDIPSPSVSSSSSSLTLLATPESSRAVSRRQQQQQFLLAPVLSTGMPTLEPLAFVRPEARAKAIAHDRRRRRHQATSSSSFTCTSFSPSTASIAAWCSGVIALPEAVDMSRRGTDVDVDLSSSASATNPAFTTKVKGDLVVDLDKVLNPDTSNSRRRTGTADTDGRDARLVRALPQGGSGGMRDATVPFPCDHSTQGNGSNNLHTRVIVPPVPGNDKPLLSSPTRRTQNQSNRSTEDYGTYSSGQTTRNHTQSNSLVRTASSSSSSHDDGLSTPATSAYAYSPVMKQSQEEPRSRDRTASEVGWTPKTVIPLSASLSSPPEDVASVSAKKRGSAGPGPAILDPRFSFPLRKNGAKPSSAPMTRSNGLSGNRGTQKSYVASLGLTPLIADSHSPKRRSSKIRSVRSSNDLSSCFDLAASGNAVAPSLRRPSLPSAEPEPSSSHTPLPPPIRSVTRSFKNTKTIIKCASNETSGHTHGSSVHRPHSRVRTKPTSAATSDVEDQKIAPLHISRSGRTRHASIPVAKIEMTFPAGPHLTHTPSSSTEAFTYPHPRLHAFELEADLDVGPVETLRSSSSIDCGSVRRVLHEQEEFQKERDEWSDASASAIGAKWNGARRQRQRRHHRHGSGSGSDIGVRRTLRPSDSAPALRGLALYGQRKHSQGRDSSSGSQAAQGPLIPPPRLDSLGQKSRAQGSLGSSAVTLLEDQRSHPKQDASRTKEPFDKPAILSPNVRGLYRLNSPSHRKKLVPSRPVESPAKSPIEDAASLRPTRPPPPIPSGVTAFSPHDRKKHEHQLPRLQTDFAHATAYSCNVLPWNEPTVSTSAASAGALPRSEIRLPSPRSRATSDAPYLSLNAGNSLPASDTTDSPLGRPSLASLRRVKGSDSNPPNSGDDTFGVTRRGYSTATESFYSVDSDPPTLGDVLPSPISDYFGSLRDSSTFALPQSPPIERAPTAASSSPHSQMSIGHAASASRNSSHSRPPSTAEGSLNLDEEGHTFEDLFFRPPPTRRNSDAFNEDQYPVTVTTSFFPDLDAQISPVLYEPSGAQSCGMPAVPSAFSTRMSAPPLKQTATSRTYESETSDSFATAEEGSGSPASVREESPFGTEPLEHGYTSSRPPSADEPRLSSISTLLGAAPTLIHVQDMASGSVRPATPSSRSSPPPPSFLDLSASHGAASLERTDASFLFFDSSGDSSTIIPSRRAPRMSQVPNDESVLPSFSPISSPRATMMGDLHPDSVTSTSSMFIEVALALSREPSLSNLDMGDDEEELAMASPFPTDVSPSAVPSPRTTFAPNQLLPPRFRDFIADDAASIATSTASSNGILSVHPSRGSGLSAWSAVSKFPLPPSVEVEESVQVEADDPSADVLDETPRPHSPLPASSLANTSVGSLLQVNDANSDSQTIHSVSSMATLRRNRSAPNVGSRSSLTIDTDEWTVAASTIRARSSEEANQSSDDDLGRLRRVMSGPAAVEELPDAPIVAARCVEPAILSERLQARRRVWSLGPAIRSLFTSTNDDGATSSGAAPIPDESRASSTQFSSRRSSWKHERTSSDPSVYQSAWPEGPEERSR